MMKIHFEGQIDAETSLQSDVDEMKEELATLWKTLAAEADQARKLREEVRFQTPLSPGNTISSYGFK
jgi:hypothetical protein